MIWQAVRRQGGSPSGVHRRKAVEASSAEGRDCGGFVLAVSSYRPEVVRLDQVPPSVSVLILQGRVECDQWSGVAGVVGGRQSVNGHDARVARCQPDRCYRARQMVSHVQPPPSVSLAGPGLVIGPRCVVE